MIKSKPSKNRANSPSVYVEPQLANRSLLQSNAILHFIGYGILILALFDLIEIFYPLNLFNSAWEFEVFGQLVERVVVPLLGLALVFCSGINGRYVWEKPLLTALSWLSLFIAVCFFLLIPLSVSNTLRIDKDNSAAIEVQQKAQMNEIVKAEEVLGKVTTPAQMNTYLGYFEDLPAEVTESTQLETTKEKLAELLQSQKRSITIQAKATQIQQRRQLLKSSIKWNLGALVSGALFVLVWQGTSWTRNDL